MVGFFRRSGTVSDVRPPAPPLAARPGAARPTLGACTVCGLDVLVGEGRDGGVLAHFLCDADVRGGVERKVEAMRSLHRAIAALTNLPDVRASLEDDVSRLPDAIEVGDAISVLERARTLVECTAMDRPEKRRLALSYLDAMLRKLAA